MGVFLKKLLFPFTEILGQVVVVLLGDLVFLHRGEVFDLFVDGERVEVVDQDNPAVFRVVETEE